MNIGDINTTTKRIRYICSQWGIRTQDIDDCIQWIFLKRIEGKSKHQLLDHSVIDWMRHLYGDSRMKHREARLSITMACKYDQNRDGRLAKEPEDHETFFKIVDLISSEKKKDIIIKHFFMGYTQREIAKEMGITPETLCYKIKNILNSLKETLTTLNMEM